MSCSYTANLNFNFTTGYIGSPIFTRKNPNPILFQTLTVPSRYRADPGTNDSPASSSDGHDSHLRSTMPSYVVTGGYLMEILRHEIAANTSPKIFDEYETAADIITAFRVQFAAYTSRQPPFLYTAGQEPIDYWRDLLENERASVLAVSNSDLSSKIQ